MESFSFEEQVSMTVDEDAIVDADSEVDSGFEPLRLFTLIGMTRVDEENHEYEKIKACFLKGMGERGKEINFVAIHRNPYSSLTGQARVKTFRIFSEALAKQRGGGANTRYAWYGGSQEEISQIMKYGFSRCRGTENGESFGSGIYLSSTNFAIDELSSSTMDDNGLRHMLLCRVILGNMEVISPRSTQFQPSSEDFDSGVDNLLSPRKYIIWSAYMNSHIFANYIVSFKAPTLPLRCPRRIQTHLVKPRSSFMEFPRLLSLLSSFLPRSTMILIEKYYTDYNEKKVSRIAFIQKLRQLAGDKLLMILIRNHGNKV
ncbi:NAD(+) ADP-ribosyltransferase [Bertholletia excelsa]